jgi:hypothetical protein
MDICYNTLNTRIGPDRTLTDGQLWAWTSNYLQESDEELKKEYISFCMELMATINKTYFEPEVVDRDTLCAWIAVKEYLQQINKNNSAV